MYVLCSKVSGSYLSSVDHQGCVNTNILKYSMHFEDVQPALILNGFLFSFTEDDEYFIQKLSNSDSEIFYEE